ncbi:MAG TPA: flavodoxin reductase, partial [Microbacterium sp.]|nr:flavodoxin reductase [Microbacterium sp.]
MIATLTSFSNRVFAVLGRLSMYRVVFLALVGLSAVALVVSVFGLVAPGPLELLATLAVLLLVSAATDAIAHRVLRLPLRLES